MDPWQPCPSNNSIANYISSSDNITDVSSLSIHNEQENLVVEDQNCLSSPNINSNEHRNKGDLSFGDNFQPFVKLPDSQEYLESLERKLKVIQKGGRKGANADSILRSLGQTKESCMIKLLSNSVETLTVEGEIFEELKVNPLLKKLAPEKQALTAEELVHLLKADQLEILLSNNNVDQEPSTSVTLEAASTESVAVESTSSESVCTEKDKDSTENLSSTEVTQGSTGN